VNNSTTLVPRDPKALRVSMIGPVPRHWGGGGKWPGGGIASHVHGLLSVLPANGVQVRLLADNTDASRQPPFPDDSPGLAFQAMVRSPLAMSSLGVGRVLRMGLRMASDPKARTSAPLGQALRFWGQAVNYDQFLSAPSTDVLHIHRAYHRQFLCQQVVRVTMPTVVTVHSVNLLVEPNPPWIGSMIRNNYQRAEWMIAVSNYVKNKIVGFGANGDRVTVITNGVDTKLFAPGLSPEARAKLDLPKDAFIVLFSGYLIARKGVDVLIKAFGRCINRHPDALLIVVGTGSEHDRLCEMSKELQVASKVLFVGSKPFLEMPLWYQACDLYVMPSWAEGLSMAILEAMACGKPVITSKADVGEHDAVIPEETGWLTDYGDVDQLAQLLDRLMDSPDTVNRAGASARRMAAQTFSWELIGQRTADAYRMLLHRRENSPGSD
jgi:phosphatidylinositol alpha-1,6-mannosyltransferase